MSNDNSMISDTAADGWTGDEEKPKAKKSDPRRGKRLVIAGGPNGCTETWTSEPERPWAVYTPIPGRKTTKVVPNARLASNNEKELELKSRALNDSPSRREIYDKKVENRAKWDAAEAERSRLATDRNQFNLAKGTRLRQDAQKYIAGIDPSPWKSEEALTAAQQKNRDECAFFAEVDRALSEELVKKDAETRNAASKEAAPILSEMQAGIREHLLELAAMVKGYKNAVGRMHDAGTFDPGVLRILNFDLGNIGDPSDPQSLLAQFLAGRLG